MSLALSTYTLDSPEQELCHVRQYNALYLKSNTYVSPPCALVINVAH